MKWWNKISETGLDNHSDRQHVRYVHIHNRIIFLASFFTGLYIPMLLLVHDYFYAAVQLVFTVLLLGAFWLNYNKWFRFSAFYGFTLIVVDLLIAISMHNEIGLEFIPVPASLAAFIIFKRKSDSVIIMLGFMASCVAGILIRNYVKPGIIIPEDYRIIFYYTNIVTAFLISGSIIVSFKNVVESYEGTILEQKREIEEKNKDMVDSITYAKRIQRSLLPTEKYLDRILSDAEENKNPK